MQALDAQLMAYLALAIGHLRAEPLKRSDHAPRLLHRHRFV